MATMGQHIAAIEKKWKAAFMILMRTKVLYEALLKTETIHEKSLRKEMQKTVDEIKELLEEKE